MIFCLAETLSSSLDLTTGLLLGQMSWIPAWLTPLWLVGLGLALGAIAAGVIYGGLALLSFIPALGTIPDSPRRGIIASLL